MEEIKLMIIIETLRFQMVELAREKGSLIDESVVELSQQLDRYLLQIQRLSNIKKLKSAKAIKTSA